jgi:hypothetical protein
MREKDSLSSHVPSHCPQELDFIVTRLGKSSPFDETGKAGARVGSITPSPQCLLIDLGVRVFFRPAIHDRHHVEAGQSDKKNSCHFLVFRQNNCCLKNESITQTFAACGADLFADFLLSVSMTG